MNTSLLPDSLSSAYFDDTSIMKCATNACDMCLFLRFRLRHPLGHERLFVHGKTLVHSCHVCFFNLAGIPVILSKSNISPIFKTHMFETCDEVTADCPTVFCSCCYRRLFMTNISQTNNEVALVEMRQSKGAKRGQRT